MQLFTATFVKNMLIFHDFNATKTCPSERVFMFFLVSEYFQNLTRTIMEVRALPGVCVWTLCVPGFWYQTICFCVLSDQFRL